MCHRQVGHAADTRNQIWLRGSESEKSERERERELGKENECERGRLGRERRVTQTVSERINRKKTHCEGCVRDLEREEVHSSGNQEEGLILITPVPFKAFGDIEA